MIRNKKRSQSDESLRFSHWDYYFNEDTFLYMVSVDNYFQRLINFEVSLVLFVKTLSNFKVFNAV